MKLLNSTQIKALDSYTMMHEPVTSEALMERAGHRLFLNIISKFPEFKHAVIFCGPGNNGGDGLVLARYFSLAGKAVEVIILKGNYTETFSSNFRRIKEQNIHYRILENLNEINTLDLSSKGIIIDALFGIGLNRPLDGLAAALVHKLNNITNYKIAIDIPSGLSADCNFKSTNENTIRADQTLSIQLPKLAFLFAENEIFVGDFECVDISLDENYIEQEESPYYYTELIDISALIKPRSRHGFKGTFGHSLIMAGSEGKSGAAILASKAALKTGCGLVTACIPESAVIPMLSNLPEALIKSGVEEDRFKDIDFSQFDALGFGPGIGLGNESSHILFQLLKSFRKPMVIDADGITLLSRNKDWYGLLNPNIILTPHPGEFDRLTHKHNSGYERFKKQLEFSKNYNVNILLKGHYTSITTPSGVAYFNSTGNNGMATAGSGDVLTGIITSLLAQGYSPTHATILGAYLHGFAGDFAALENSKTSMIASDIITGIPAFFKQFE